MLSTDDARKDDGDLETVYIDYKSLTKSTDVGRNIFIDDGQLRLEVLEVHENHVKVKALNNWTISNNKGVNLPMVSGGHKDSYDEISVDYGGLARIVRP